MTLGEIGDMATQQVLMDLWVRGLPYPGASGDIWEDGLYQGTLFINGIDESTHPVENYFDRFPGPGDGYLDWYDASGSIKHNADGSVGDGIPDNQQPIDIDGDGVLDLVKDDGQGVPLADGVYRAVATGTFVTFH